MKPIGEIITPEPEKPAPKKKGGPRCERDELFDYFYMRLAGPWERHTGKPLRKSYFGMRIAHLKLHDLHYLKSICKEAQRDGIPPSKVFWGSLKPRPDDAVK